MHFHSEPAFAAMHASLTPLVEFMYCAPPDKHASAGSCFCTTLTAKQPPTRWLCSAIFGGRRHGRTVKTHCMLE